MRVFVAGASGYIGQWVVRTLIERGHDVVAFARPRSGVGGVWSSSDLQARLPGAKLRLGEVTSETSVLQDGFQNERFDAVISCLATRGGAVQDAWDIELESNRHLLTAALSTKTPHFVLLSAICVQKPKLAFQHAKLAFERVLVASGLRYSIVRPTAFFKSLSGQIESIRAGKAFVMFGDGRVPQCKPIGEKDLAQYIVDCLTDPARRNQILPIGGPGPVISPRMQGELLAAAFGQSPKFRRVPLWVFDAIIFVLSALGILLPALKDKAEYARIGRYYASESMLVWDEKRREYSAEQTPVFGQDTLEDFYKRAAEKGLVDQELGDHTLFARSKKARPEPGLES